MVPLLLLYSPKPVPLEKGGGAGWKGVVGLPNIEDLLESSEGGVYVVFCDHSLVQQMSTACCTIANCCYWNMEKRRHMHSHKNSTHGMLVTFRSCSCCFFSPPTVLDTPKPPSPG